MKNLFNDISQDEKNRILEMHSGKKNVISEQNPFSGQPSRTRPNPTRPNPNPTRPNRPTPKPSGAVNVPQPKKVVEGMTVNLYNDYGQSQQPERHTIVKIKENNGMVELQLDKDAELSLSAPKLVFKCGDNNMEMTSNVMDTGKRVYNKELVKSLQNQFCMTNKQGATVPKADFAMNNQSTDTTTGIA
jgi:hypothetical protein